MRNIRRFDTFVLALAVLIVSASLALSGEPMPPGFAAGGIKSGLSRSPDLYVAGVVEVTGPQQCKDSKDVSTCTADVKLVEVLASRGRKFKRGSVLSMFGAGGGGERYRAFLVPMPDRSDVFGSTFLAVDASAEDRNLFAEELADAGLKPGD